MRKRLPAPWNWRSQLEEHSTGEIEIEKEIEDKFKIKELRSNNDSDNQ